MHCASILGDVSALIGFLNVLLELSMLETIAYLFTPEDRNCL
jgi:hypothetical protein